MRIIITSSSTPIQVASINVDRNALVALAVTALAADANGDAIQLSPSKTAADFAEMEAKAGKSPAICFRGSWESVWLPSWNG